MTNLEIAQSAKMLRIEKIASSAGLSEEDFEPTGRFKAKLTTTGIERVRQNKRGKLILVSAMTPTTKGEGKTTCSVGIAQGLCKIGKRAMPVVREPALGPVFGLKGGACGGGYSQVLPMEEINLFFNGDFPAISAAHNLLSALIDAHIHNGNELGIDVRDIPWPRTVDMNDRSLREIIIGLGGKSGGFPRQDSFVITPASEIMALLCLCTSLSDLSQRLERIIIGSKRDRTPVTAKELLASGAMSVLLRDAIRPNLVQTIEGGPAIVHGGPFGNIAHGCSSILASICGLGICDYVVTEAGFGSDLGAEKFLNIVCPIQGFGPDIIVLVATIKAVQYHSESEDISKMHIGFENLRRHHRHLSKYGLQVVVAVNKFAFDTDEEIKTLLSLCAEHGMLAIVIDPFSQGGAGCTELAALIVNETDEPKHFKSIIDQDATIVEKINTIVTEVYEGAGVEFSSHANAKIAWAHKNGFGSLPVCIAKTQYSFTDNPVKINAPTGFKVEIKDLKVCAGSGFCVALAGDMMLMPGLGKSPAAHNISLDNDGKISGMF